MGMSVHPRPRFVRSPWQSLDGPWDHAFSEADEPDAVAWEGSIRVPFPPESRLSGVHDTGFHPCVWYRRSFTVPESWRSGRVILHFGAVDHEAVVHVNERLVARHEGGHTPFRVDITDALVNGTQTVYVRAADDPHDLEKPEYCNGTKDTALVKLRHSHGFEAPHEVRYWGVGNEVDGPWQIGFKTPEEYARTYTEYAKVMKWTDPSIKLVASAVSVWEREWVERTQLLVEQAGPLIDYLALHWYVGNDTNRGYANDDFASYMAISELIEDRLAGYEGLVRALQVANRLKHPIPIAVDEWNVWYRTGNEEKLEEVYNLEDALVVGMHFNAFFRHATTVKMANLAQVVNVIAPVLTRPDGLLLQTIFHPFELVRRTAGNVALDVHWESDTFSSVAHDAVRLLDVSATLDEAGRRLSVYVVNRSPVEALETELLLDAASFAGEGTAATINGPDVRSVNTFEAPDTVTTRRQAVEATGNRYQHAFEPHSMTALSFELA